MVNERHPKHDLLTPSEVIEYLRVNVRTVYRLMRTGELPAVRVGRQWRIRRADLDSWLGQPQPEPSWNRLQPLARAAGDERQPNRVPSPDREESYGAQE